MKQCWLLCRMFIAAAVALSPVLVRAHGGFVDFAMSDRSDAWQPMSREVFDGQRVLGNQFARIDLYWSDIEVAPGQFDFTAADGVFNAVSAGIFPMRAVPTVYVGRGWMTCDRPCRALVEQGECEAEADICKPGCECCQRCPASQALSLLPSDLMTDPGARPDPVFAYSKSYYRFIRELVRHFEIRLTYLLIESQIDNPRYWDTERDPGGLLYLRLLATAYKAVKDTAPAIIVIDAGLNSVRVATCVAKDALESGSQTAEQTHSMLSEHFTSSLGAATPVDVPPLGSPAELADYLRTFDGCQVLANLLTSRLPDVWNLRYFESPRTMHLIQDYYQRYEPRAYFQLGSYVIATDVGCRRQRNPDPIEEARCAFKSISAAQALRVPIAVWSRGENGEGVSMWDADGQQRLAALPYRLLASTLGARYRFVSAELGPEVFRARFFNVITNETVADVLWSWDNEIHTVRLDENFGYFPKRAVNYLNTPIPLQPAGCAGASVQLSEDPLLVIYDRPLTPVMRCTPTATPPPSATRTPTRTRTPGPCMGDCSGDRKIDVSELILGVRIALGEAAIDDCGEFDRDSDGTVTVDELLAAIHQALADCGGI